MRLVIDLQGAQGENRGRGIGRYAEALTEAIIRQSGGHDIQILLNSALETEESDLQRHFIDLLCPKSVKVWMPDEQPYERMLAGLAPDRVLLTSLFEGINTPARTDVTGIPTAVVAYDLIPLVMRERYLDKNPTLESWYLERLEQLRR
ncbi:MAG TPA: hypothetical protein VKP60_15540, partial [Magnetospirillaceae bacterium]|nr:hypothetical protein [Magnetospirillaceae bacterium]